MRNFLSFHGFEPSFVDQTSVMHTRGAACGATRREAALLENFGVKSRLHTSCSQSKQHRGSECITGAGEAYSSRSVHSHL